jgi:hypothetical protein
MEKEINVKQKFTRKIAKEIAMTSFGYMLDCLIGNSDSGYSLTDDAEIFEQNFEEDLVAKNITVTERRIKIISEEYDNHCKKLIAIIRKKYYSNP